MCSLTHTLSPSLFIWLGRPTRPLCLHRNAFICRSKVMISVWRRASESLCTQVHFLLLPLLQPLLIFFFISPAGSWISQEQQLHYQPEMYSSILLLSSDKGTARQVTRAHGELCRKQHFFFFQLQHGAACQWRPNGWGRKSLLVCMATVAARHNAAGFSLQHLKWKLPNEDERLFKAHIWEGGAILH